MARVTRTFVDPADVTHIYRQGDAYPREGVKPDKGRTAELKRAGLIDGADADGEEQQEQDAPRRARQRPDRR